MPKNGISSALSKDLAGLEMESIDVNLLEVSEMK